MVLEAIKKRQSVRSYQDKEVPEEILQQILEAGRLAPSAKNTQSWKFIVVKDKDLRKKLVPACKNQEFVGEAPVVIAGCGTNLDYVMSNGEHAYSINKFSYRFGSYELTGSLFRIGNLLDDWANTC